MPKLREKTAPPALPAIWKWFCTRTLAAVLGVAIGHASGAELGVVLLHGGKGSPVAIAGISGLADNLRRAGYEVVTPNMPWGANRYYDATFDDAMREVDQQVEILRQKGAVRIVVAGQSFGANVALGYAADRGGVAGVIALAPGHTPETPLAIKLLGADVQRAKDLVAAGKGKEAAKFLDANQGQTLTVTTTPEIYLSWLDPDGKAVMPKSVAAFKSPIPLLIVVGSRERMAGGRDYIFDKAPPHTSSRFATVPADHTGVPDAASDEVLKWLNALPK
jgi:pimeloyl-ACP methyl ester carboxylesterase